MIHTPRLVRADVAVVGAGPAGLAAACRGAEAGARVVLLDEGLAAGGQIWRHAPGTPPPRDAQPWVDRLARSGATTLFGTSVVDLRRDGAGAPFVVSAERGPVACRVVAQQVVVAAGARERLLPFPGWTLPGVIGVGGAQALLKSGVSFAGKRVVVAGTGPLILPVAAALAAAGARLLLVAEQAPLGAVAGFAATLWRRPALAAQAARYRLAFARTRYTTGSWVTAAEGDGRLERVVVRRARGGTRALDCDVLCVGYGLVENTELARLVGGATDGGAVVVDDRQETSVQGLYCAGESTGVGGVDLSLVEGQIAGLAAAGVTPAAALVRARAELRALAGVLARTFAPRAELRALATPDTVVCRCEDVRCGALDRAWSPRQAKLYTRAGMGPCQGRVCGPALEFLFGWPADAVRPPVKPILLSTLLADAAPDAAPLDQGVA